MWFGSCLEPKQRNEFPLRMSPTREEGPLHTSHSRCFRCEWLLSNLYRWAADSVVYTMGLLYLWTQIR